MANKTYAKEWLTFAIKNLNTAKSLPAKEEIKEILDFTNISFDKICNLLEIDKGDLIL